MTADHVNTLNGVLEVLKLPNVAVDKVLKHMSIDSRNITDGDLFIAIPGIQSDGRHYITNALENGAAAVFVDDSEGCDVVIEHKDVFIVPGLCEKLGFISDHFYRCPSEKVKIFGVTGTNGKTSCCWFISEILRHLGEPCALMGTLGRGLPGQLQPSLHTTSDVVSVHQYLAQLVADGVPSLAMEVSSHGLDQKRIAGVLFEVALFTHISREHLDYHGSMEQYAAAKAKLFSECHYKYAVIGKDDQYSKLMMSACPVGADVTTWSLSDVSADVYLSDIHPLSQGFTATLHSPWGKGEMTTSLLGRFNLENLLAVMAVLGVNGYSMTSLLNTIPLISSPPGRIQQLGGGAYPVVIVDFAHTPDALQSVLCSLREHCSVTNDLTEPTRTQCGHGSSHIICVYGCGGDRDRGKRPLMTMAALNADTVVLTSDNPRTEDPNSIVADALEGVKSDDCERIRVIVDRAEAIRSAILSANPDDIVVVAGKGHETYQEVHGVRYHFDDVQQVQSVLECEYDNIVSDKL